MRIDLNCDLGEGAGQDQALMPLVTSANIACGGHAGDDETMRTTVALARQHGVAIGAHPSFEDRPNFGRRELSLPPKEISRQVKVQIRRLLAIAGPDLRHVKPHGALYNMAARDERAAAAIIAGIRAVNPNLLLVGLAGSVLLDVARMCDLPVASEVFADRAYRPDGSLVPRSEKGALIDDESAAVAQVLSMVREARVKAIDGTWVPVTADTICLHGDGPHAVPFARRLRTELEQAGVSVGSMPRSYPAG